MNYLPMLTEDEIRYVCSIIPQKHVISYFKQNPKEFAKIRPGFRPEKAAKLDICNLLFNSRNRHFILSFIEKCISQWLGEIGAAINEKINEGESKESAMLQTLPLCFFVDNIGLYFKLTGEEHAEEFLSLLSESIKTIKKEIEEREQTNTKLEKRTVEVSRLEAELGRVENEQRKLKQKLSECTDELMELKRTKVDVEKSKTVIDSIEQTITSLKQKAQERDGYIQQLKIELSATKNEQLQLEQKIREELVKQQEIEMNQQNAAQKPKCPKDLDEFKDYLGYNFENIGVQTGADYFSLLKDHLSEVLFQGKPIIISRSTGFSLMKCVSNTIAKTPMVSNLAFANEVAEKSIEAFLSQDRRILCLDNFIGNYNETTLITLCDRHKDKIIFLTVAYDHTLAYVPDELLRYCHYLNLNRIEAFAIANELTEDPSDFEEVEAENASIVMDTRWSIALKEMLDEFGMRGALPVHKSYLVADELHLCCQLAFDILPYCTDVLKINPFSVSERLVKYAGSNGRCSYKDLFRRWF